MKSPRSKTIDTYDEIASQYCDYLEERLPQFNLTKFSSFILKNKVDQIFKEVKARSKGKTKKPKETGQKILDIGCGGGRDVGYLLEEGFIVHGIDASEKIIKEAKKRVKNGKFKVMDLMDLSYKDDSFDGIWCLGPLLHIKKKELGKTLKGFHRILRPGGIIFISTEAGDEEKLMPRKELMGKKVFCAFYQQPELEDMITDAGFDIISSAVETAGETMVTIYAKKRLF